MLNFVYGAIHKVRRQVEGGAVMAKAYGCVQGEEEGKRGGRRVKPGEYVSILTVYFLFLKIFSIKKKNEND